MPARYAIDMLIYAIRLYAAVSAIRHATYDA